LGNIILIRDGVQEEMFILGPENCHSLLSRDSLKYVLDDFELAISFLPNSLQSHYGLGRAYMEVCEWQKSLDEFSQASQIDPSNKFIHFAIGSIWSLLGNDEEARKAWGKSSLNTCAIYLLRARAYNQRGLSLSALDEYNLALLQPNQLQDDVCRAQAFYEAGHIYATKGDLEKAKNYLYRALLLVPSWLDLYLDLARISFNKEHDFKQAESILLLGIERNPGAVTLYEELGYYLIFSKRYEEASEWLDMAISRFPSSQILTLHKAMAAYYLGNYTEAMMWAINAVELDPKEPYGHYFLGKSYFYSGMVEQAIREYRIAIELYSDNEYFYASLGDAYKSLGMRANALGAYHRALALNPNFAQVQENIVELEFGR